MKVHIIMDLSNVLGRWTSQRLRYPQGLLLNIDDHIMQNHERGYCSVVRSKSLEIPATSYCDDEVMDLFERGYSDRCLDLVPRKAKCPRCDHCFDRLWEKSVDSRIIEELYGIGIKAEKGDTIVLVSGDHDFINPLMRVREHFGLQIKVGAFTEQMSRVYRGSEFIDAFPLDGLLAVA